MAPLFPLDQAMPQPTHEGLLQLTDVSLFVRQFGTAGPAVVLIHGDCPNSDRATRRLMEGDSTPRAGTG